MNYLVSIGNRLRRFYLSVILVYWLKLERLNKYNG